MDRCDTGQGGARLLTEPPQSGVSGGFPLLLTEDELVALLRIPEVSKTGIVKAAQDSVLMANAATSVQRDLPILMALCTAMRRGELLNCLWSDIDFAEQTVTVSPKENTPETWLWQIKDTDRRTLPLTAELTQMLVDHQSRQPEGCPYVFVPPARYRFIQNELRAKGKWTYSDSRLKVVSNFERDSGLILKKAAVKTGEFHDLRRTAISNWLAKGLGEFEVMKLAGHSNFSTTHRFYLRVRDDMIDRARKASTRATSSDLARIWHASPSASDAQKNGSRDILPMREL